MYSGGGRYVVFESMVNFSSKYLCGQKQKKCAQQNSQLQHSNLCQCYQLLNLKKANLATLNSLVIAAAYQRRQKHPLNTTLNPISIVPTMYTLQFFSVL